MDTAEILSIARRFETLERLLRDTRDRLLSACNSVRELEDRLARVCSHPVGTDRE